MPLSETDLQQMSYREVVELAKVNGVYQKKSAKKAALIRRLSTVWTNDEFTGIENVDPNRTAPLTPLEEVDESHVSASDCEDQERRRTFTKARSKTSDPALKSIAPPKRQNTFTKSDQPNTSLSTTVEEDASPHNDIASSETQRVVRTSKKKTSQEDKSIAPPSRQNTFTKEDESMVDSDSVSRSNKTKRGSLVHVPVSPKRTENPLEGSPSRRNTFTKGSPKPVSTKSKNGQTRRSTSSPQKNVGNEGILDDNTSLVREGTFTKTPEKKESDIPVLHLNTEKTPTPIEKLSVFQRLSAKIPLSDRRSLVTSEKRVSVKTSFYTPQIDKRSQLNALREARKSHTTPKSLMKNTTVSAAKTPIQPTVKSSATSTKKSSVKKPPNFAEIHKRNFAKMESLLENRKRLRERAEFMSPSRRTQTCSSIPKRFEGTNGPSKSGGKKSNIPVLQKKMSVKERLKVAMANKCSTGAVMLAKDKKFLKGVRINKRFELQLALKQKKA